MNSTFRSYPSHPWLLEWPIEPRDCGTAFREKNSGYFFRTMEPVGHLCPNQESPEWHLAIPLPQNSRINLMFNGFCGYHTHRKIAHSAETTTPEAGVLWGRFSNIPAPTLISESAIETTDGFQWIEADAIPALLAVRDGHFCLVTKAHLFDEAVRIAEGYLEEDFDTHLQAELKIREGASALFERMSHHDALAAACSECMMRAIRPAEGSILTRWSQSKTEGAPQLDINEIHPLALAWRQLDPDTAEELFLGVLKLQGNAGAIPVAYAPNQTFSVLEAPKPMLAKTAEKIWETQKNPHFLSEAIPLLRRHLQWLLHHFDPKRRGLHHWQNSPEPLDPKNYESELATVDLSALLLTEIEAFNRLRTHAPDAASRNPLFTEEQNTLKNNLSTQFWNEQSLQYNTAYLRNTRIQRDGFSTLIPLLCHHLPKRQKELVFDQIRKSNTLPGGHNILSWRSMVPDGHTFPLLQQTLLLEILETHDPNGETTRNFTRLMLQEFTEWHTRSIKEHSTLELDPAMAGFIINLMSAHHYLDHAKNTPPGFLYKLAKKSRINWMDAAIIAITIFTATTARTLYSLHRQPPPFAMLAAQINTAYTGENSKTVLRTALLIIKHYPEQAGLARLLAGNIELMRRNPAEAELFLRDVRKEYPDSPSAMVSLGLAYQLQGRIKEADAVYAEFTYLFDEIFPKLVKQIQQYRYLMEEGLRSPPPKWREIYRYPLMHEL